MSITREQLSDRLRRLDQIERNMEMVQGDVNAVRCAREVARAVSSLVTHVRELTSGSVEEQRVEPHRPPTSSPSIEPRHRDGEHLEGTSFYVTRVRGAHNLSCKACRRHAVDSMLDSGMCRCGSYEWTAVVIVDADDAGGSICNCGEFGVHTVRWHDEHLIRGAKLPSRQLSCAVCQGEAACECGARKWVERPPVGHGG